MSKARPPIYFVRHGETDWNVQGLIQGWTDIELNQKGHTQARAVAAAMKNVPDFSPDFNFVVSPLLRARQTMGYIAEALELEPPQIAIEPAVTELGFGIWEGKPFWELKASPIYPPHPEDRYFWRPREGESYEDGHARINAWLDTLDRPTVVVAHGAIGRCLIAEIASLPRRDLVELAMKQGFYCKLADGRAEWFDATADAA
ncbi:MAG: histidine phosphatase family protein [Aestuariivirga sp.]|uniref:histidine phosphatase family protein n=1 Tax=Aestuariivirga sp. TaxID=2650926 RepID=UPI0030167270